MKRVNDAKVAAEAPPDNDYDALFTMPFQASFQSLSRGLAGPSCEIWADPQPQSLFSTLNPKPYREGEEGERREGRGRGGA